MRSAFTVIITLFFSVTLLAQNSQSDYLEAKRLYGLEDYISADAAFLDLQEDVQFGSYAQFYRGLIQYQQGEKRAAVALWNKLRSDYPTWLKDGEVLYWLSISNFELGAFDIALSKLDQYTRASMNVQLAEVLIPYFLQEEMVEDLKAYQASYPELRPLAKLYARRIAELPVSERPDSTLQNLIFDYELSIASLMQIDVKNVKKATYHIGLALPFMFEQLSDPTATVRNRIVMELYQGFAMAKEELQIDGKELVLHCFDTKKEADTTWLHEESLAQMDLIIGPLYPGPIDVVKEISAKYQINMISPLTSNSSYMEGNKFAMLANPSYETMARSLASFVSAQAHKKSAFVYFTSDERDSLFAEVYRSSLIKDSIEVVDFRSVDRLTAKYLLDSLTAQYAQYYPKSMADSIGEIEGRFVKYRNLRTEEIETLDSLVFYETDEDGRLVDRENPQKMLAYEMLLKIVPDTVGHIMIASRSMAVYNNFVSARAARQDSIGIYGYSNWFDNNLVNYNLMDQVNVKVAVSDFVDSDRSTYPELMNRLSKKFMKVPSQYHLLGYDLLCYLGEQLHVNGKYFQLEAYQSGRTKGVITHGYDFSGANDNQVVPILELEEYRVKTVNY